MVDIARQPCPKCGEILKIEIECAHEKSLAKSQAGIEELEIKLAGFEELCEVQSDKIKESQVAKDHADELLGQSLKREEKLMVELEESKASLEKEHENFLMVHRDNIKAANRIAELNSACAAETARATRLMERQERLECEFEEQETKIAAYRQALEFYADQERSWVIRACDHHETACIDPEKYPKDHEAPWTRAQEALKSDAGKEWIEAVREAVVIFSEKGVHPIECACAEPKPWANSNANACDCKLGSVFSRLRALLGEKG